MCAGGRQQFYGVSIDSRTVRANQLFVAVKGKNFDGHDFVSSVLQRGVRGVVVKQDYARAEKRRLKGAKATCVAVDDTVHALGRLGRFRRRNMKVTVVAITGTNGKTTTREMTAGIVARHWPVLVPARNFNNEIGVPLTLLRLEEHHRVAVLELGMNAPGEIRQLAEICEPDIGVVLNVGAGHLAGVGDLEGVAGAKAELVEALDEKATVILNADDPRVLKMAEKAAGSVLTCGCGKKGDVRAENVKREKKGQSFEINFKQKAETLAVFLSASGDHMVLNSLMAASVADLLGVRKEDIKAGLESFAPVRGRMAIIESRAGFTIVDDTYNANPASVAAAVDSLAKSYPGDRKILVLGDMYELGDEAEYWHWETGVLAVSRGINKIYAVGEFAAAVAGGAVSAGMSDKNIVTGSKTEVAESLQRLIGPGDRILVKGSRPMTMETVVDMLAAHGGVDISRQKEQG